MTQIEGQPLPAVWQAELTVPEAYQLLWATGNYALEHDRGLAVSAEARHYLADYLTYWFASVDVIKVQAQVTGEEGKVSMWPLLTELEIEQGKIYDQQVDSGQTQKNPYSSAVKSARWTGMNHLRNYVEQAYQESAS